MKRDYLDEGFPKENPINDTLQWLDQAFDKVIKKGKWKHLAELLKDKENLLDFYNWFNIYHSAILLTEVTWSKGKYKYCIIKPLGVFTDLNKLSLKIQSEINKYNKDKTELKVKETVWDQCGAEKIGEVLHIHTPHESYELTFIEIDETDKNNPPFEGWKFDLK